MHNSLKQPSGLYILFGAEMWERFGFYCVQSFLVLYLTKVLGFDDAHADDLYSAFSGLLYAAPVIGGFLADYVLGFRRAIICGAILYILGYFLMLSNNTYAFYFALSLLIGGNGYFKANVSSLLGTLYSANDPRRDSGFTIFYLGINVGTLLGPMIASVVAEKYGYNYGFASCGIGMLIGLVTFLWGKKYLGRKGIYPSGERGVAKHSIKNKQRILTYALTILAIIGISFSIDQTNFIFYGITLFCIASVGYILYLTIDFPSRESRLKVIALLILFVFSLVFWAMYMQMFTSLILFSERNVNRVFFGWTVPTPVTTVIIPIFIILLAPLVAKLWLKIADTRWDFSYGTKFALGHLFQGISFLILIIGALFPNDHYQVAFIWLILSGLLRVIGELCLSPIGLSAVTKLTPTQFTGMMMGVWFLTISGGLVLGNKFALIAVIPSGLTDPAAMLHIYQSAFVIYMIVSLACAIILFLLTPLLKKLTHS